MKISNYLLVLLTLFFLSSCSKEHLTVEDTSPSHDALGMLKDEVNAENNQINQVLYLFNQATLQVARDPKMLEIISKEMAEHPTVSGWPVIEIAKQNDLFASALAAKIKNIAKNEQRLGFDLADLDGVELIQFLDDKMTYQGDTYYTVYYRLDKLPTSVNKETIFAIGEEVFENDNDDDQILGYTLDGQDLLVGEQDAMDSKVPILCIGNGVRGEHSSESYLSGKQKISSRNINTFQIIQHQIKAGYRYERGRRSEIDGAFFTYDTNFGGLEHLEDWDHYWVPFFKWEINASMSFNTTRTIGGNVDGTYVFLVAVERDWYTSMKVIPNTQHTNRWVASRRKYTHEYYMNSTFVTDSFLPSNGSTYHFSNNKCSFTFKKVN